MLASSVPLRAACTARLGGADRFFLVMAPEGRLRLGVYCDFAYRVSDDGISAELPFSLFLEGLARHCDRLVVFGRLDPTPGEFPYKVRNAELVALPYYGSGADLAGVMRAIPAAMRRFWSALDDLDAVWILGPNPPQALLFAIAGVLRRRRVVLGVRQNLPELIRHRRPDARGVIASAYLLEWTFRALAMLIPVVVVGPDLARRYRHARSQLSIYVSLLRKADLDPPGPGERRYDGDELVILSVGRLDPEKNPLLLADVLCAAVQTDDRWRLEVCGDGPLAQALDVRAGELGVSDRLLQHGYVPIDAGLWSMYRRAHVLLHVSMTEGVPQVILEAFAARLPVVATGVGGVTEIVGGRGLVVAPGDARAAAAALQRIADEPALRRRLVAAAHRTAEDHTLSEECSRVAGFLSMNS